MRTVVSFQSMVMYGYVGNSVATPILQSRGVTTWSIPSIVLAQHNGYGTNVSMAPTSQQLEEIIHTFEQRGVWPISDALIIGYQPTANSVSAALHMASKIRTATQSRYSATEVVGSAAESLTQSGRHPEFDTETDLAAETSTGSRTSTDSSAAGPIVIVDPVIGDYPRGRYVPEAAATAIASHLIPVADVITPNHFELEYLSGTKVASSDDALSAARMLLKRMPPGGCVVTTSLGTKDVDPGVHRQIATTELGSVTIDRPRHDRHFSGAGDVFTAMFTSQLLMPEPTEAERGNSLTMRSTGSPEPGIIRALANAGNATQRIIEATADRGSSELALIEGLASISRMRRS